MYTKERTNLLAKSDVGSGLGIADKSSWHQWGFQGFFYEKKASIGDFRVCECVFEWVSGGRWSGDGEGKRVVEWKWGRKLERTSKGVAQCLEA